MHTIFTRLDPASAQNVVDRLPASAFAPTFHSPSRILHWQLLFKSWSKQNLKNGERSAWSRGRDGWSPVVGNNATDVGGASTGGKGPGMVEGNGEIRFVLYL